MKLRYTATIMVVFLLLTLGWAYTAHASESEDFLIRRYGITLVVECLDEAILQMRNLPGLELSSRINITAGRGQAQRIVDSRDLNLALDILHQMGDTASSDSRADNAFARWVALRRETTVRQHEYNRLVELLHESTEMHAFHTIENRLNTVIGTMEDLRGDLQGIEFQMGTTRIDITLLIPEQEYEPEPEPEYEPEAEPEPGAFERIADTFMRSAELTGRGLQLVAMFFAYVSIPLTGFVAVLLIVLWVVRRTKRKSNLTNHANGKGGDKNEEL